jgi:hypothetical protein
MRNETGAHHSCGGSTAAHLTIENKVASLSEALVHAIQYLETVKTIRLH